MAFLFFHIQTFSRRAGDCPRRSGWMIAWRKTEVSFTISHRTHLVNGCRCVGGGKPPPYISLLHGRVIFKINKISITIL